jgi:hypothetical protein
MSALPLNLIKGTRSATYERLENTEDIEEVEQHIQTIKSKVSWCFVVIGNLKIIFEIPSDVTSTLANT